MRRGLPAPSGFSNDAAEIATDEVRVLPREHGFHLAERRRRLVLCKIDIHTASPAQVFEAEVGSQSAETNKLNVIFECASVRTV
jgi:hypothetical protein